MTITKLFRFIVFMMMLTTFFPLVFYRLPPIIGSSHVYALLFVLSLLFLKPKVFANRLVLLNIVYGAFLLFMLQFWTHLDPWAKSQIWQDYYYITMGILMITYFQETGDFKGLAYISAFTLIFILITALGTIVASFILGSTERAALFGDDAALESTQIIFAKYGSGSYGSSIVFMSIIAILVYYFKHIDFLVYNKKWVMVVGILLLFGGVLRLQIFVNVIFAVFVFLFSVMDVYKDRKSFYILSFIALVLFVIPQSQYISLLYWLSDLFRGVLDEMSFKFEEFAVFFQYGSDINMTGNAVAGRAERFPLLLDGFLKYPFWGCSVSPIAQPIAIAGTAHLYWMFKLSMMGVFNLVFCLSIFYVFIRQEQKYLSKAYFYYFFIAVMSVLLYGIPKVTGNRESWYFLFFIAPGLYYLPLTNPKVMRYMQFKRDRNIAKEEILS